MGSCAGGGITSPPPTFLRNLCLFVLVLGIFISYIFIQI
jgi:hypothetical protein